MNAEMKIVVIQESILQPDITREALAERWKRIQTLPGVSELNIFAPKQYPTIEALNGIVGDADALFGVWVGPDLINPNFLQSHPRLRYIGTLGHGWEPFDMEITKRHGLAIANTIYGSQSIAEYAFSLLLEVCHHVSVHDKRIKAIDWSQETNREEFCKAVTPQIELFGKTIGIIGLGEIGFSMAKMAAGFGMRVVAYSAHKKTGDRFRFVEQLESLDELLQECDFISLHLPHTPATEHIINATTIAKMKSGAILINTARGALVDEQALANALTTGKVSAAGLDVLTEEPPLQGTPLLSAPNVTITGHVAWLTRESRFRAVDMAIDNFSSYLQGTPKSLIN